MTVAIKMLVATYINWCECKKKILIYQQLQYCYIRQYS